MKYYLDNAQDVNKTGFIDIPPVNRLTCDPEIASLHLFWLTRHLIHTI